MAYGSDEKQGLKKRDKRQLKMNTQNNREKKGTCDRE